MNPSQNLGEIANSVVYIAKSPHYHILETRDNRGVCGNVARAAQSGKFSQPYLVEHAQFFDPGSRTLCQNCADIHIPDAQPYASIDTLSQHLSILNRYLTDDYSLDSLAPVLQAINFILDKKFTNRSPWGLYAERALTSGRKRIANLSELIYIPTDEQIRLLKENTFKENFEEPPEQLRFF